MSSERDAYLDDKMYLPIQYLHDIAEEPYYSGDGSHSVAELEDICRKYKEYVHQQAVIKQSLKNIVLSLKGIK